MSKNSTTKTCAVCFSAVTASCTGAVQIAKPKPEAAPEQMVRTAHLAIPVTRCRTTFVGGVNPWGLVT